MRIRKNANLSSSLKLSQAEVLQAHVCQLNQSPWDVIPFSQDAYQSYLIHQFQGEDGFNGNGSLGDSIGAVESSSVASLMDDDTEDKAASIKINGDDMVMDDNYDMETIPDKKRVFKGCEFKFKKRDKIHSFNNGKGWHCQNDQKEGQSMCDHHSPMLKSHGNSNNVTSCTAIPTSPSMKKTEKAVSGTRRCRAKGAKKGHASSSNPYEFYYYSGFGPLWGKRRGDRGEGNKNGIKELAEMNGAATECNTTPFSTPSPIEHHDDRLDFVDEDDDDDEGDDDSENGDFGKKRMRKPVKARSLKSLM